MVERICQRAKSEGNNERVRHDESGESEDELSCLIGGEREGDSIEIEIEIMTSRSAAA